MRSIESVRALFEEERRREPIPLAGIRTRIRAAERLLSAEALPDLPEPARRHLRAVDRLLAYAGRWKKRAVYRMHPSMTPLVTGLFRDWRDALGYAIEHADFSASGTVARTWPKESLVVLRGHVIQTLAGVEDQRRIDGSIMAPHWWFEAMFHSALALSHLLLGQERALALFKELKELGELVNQCVKIHDTGAELASGKPLPSRPS